MVLRGDFSFDAVSPDGSRLYLIQYVSPQDPTRYLVRAYDLERGRLLARPISDPRERGREMHGSPLTRTTSAGGRWAYTLYDGADSTPFVHALDTRAGAARCVDLPSLAGTSLGALRLRLGAGNVLAVVRGRRTVAAIDTASFDVLPPAPEPKAGAHGGTDWSLVGLAGAGAALLAGASLFGLRRRRAWSPWNDRGRDLARPAARTVESGPLRPLCFV